MTPPKDQVSKSTLQKGDLGFYETVAGLKVNLAEKRMINLCRYVVIDLIAFADKKGTLGLPTF